MTRVSCFQSECINNNEEVCSLDSISLAFDCGFSEEVCSDYTDYNNTPEYQTHYFIRVN